MGTIVTFSVGQRLPSNVLIWGSRANSRIHDQLQIHFVILNCQPGFCYIKPTFKKHMYEMTLSLLPTLDKAEAISGKQLLQGRWKRALLWPPSELSSALPSPPSISPPRQEWASEEHVCHTAVTERSLIKKRQSISYLKRMSGGSCCLRLTGLPALH